ncbi:MAG: ATP-dependent Clp protease ATP-binding subunit [Cytophagales bacterium]|nr:ATP-dependent Clp protease ATP-binding subunit [Cytophagales bacterium]
MLHTLDYILTAASEKAIHIAQALAKENQHPKFSCAHLLKALLHKDIGLLPLLEQLKIDIYYLQEWAEVRMESLPKTATVLDPVPGDDLVDCVLLEADTLRLKLSHEEIDPILLLAALVSPGVGFSRDQLKSMPLTAKELLQAVTEKVTLTGDGTSSLATDNGSSAFPAMTAGALEKYCTDKLDQARAGDLDRIIGRDREVRMIVEILGRRSKPNVIITGEPGVGKTALVEGFALQLATQTLPGTLKEARLFELDMGSLLAGASYKGEVEDRLKSILAELKTFSRAILFIDEIHVIMDKATGNQGIINILKPELARGTLTVIGATTHDEYRKHVESDEAFKRRFETLTVDPPDDTTTKMMMKGVLPYYEEHHQVKLADQAVEDSIRLAKRYIQEKQLPDAALDLVDRTMSAVKNLRENAEKELLEIQQEMDEMQANEEYVAEEVAWFVKTLKDRVSYLLFTEIEEATGEQEAGSKDEAFGYLTALLGKLKTALAQRGEEVTGADLAATVSQHTGIPLGKIRTQERERLLNMEKHLKARVVGQDHTLTSLTEAILESRSGLARPGQPIGSFFFLGPTGTGKTELAKALAEFLFETESAMIRFDMSEFKEEHSAALLYGAPPGYVGYEEGGMLVNKIRQQPYAVVLFDEIEKAHKSVFDIFLQILDEGKLNDRLGKQGDFSNAVVLFTSNIGSDHIIKSFAEDRVPPSSELLEIMSAYFRPEFLGRLSGILPFSPITEDNILQIFDIQLEELLVTLGKQGITLEVTQEARKHLATLGFTPKYGARPLKGVIRAEVRSPLSRMIVAGSLKKGDTIRLDVDKNGKVLWKN